MVNDWLTMTEAAAYLKVRPRTLASWVRQGKAPAHKLSGTKRRVWRFLRSELDGMLSAPSAGPTDREAA
jgi:excisionase family DNA binding protein